MPAAEYWEGDPFLVNAYEEAFRLKREQMSYDAWLQGLYIYQAVGAVVSSAITGKRKDYMKKPIRITPLTQREKDLEAEKVRVDIAKNLTLWEKRWKKEKGVK